MTYLAFLKKKLSKFKKTVPSESESNSKKEIVKYKSNETWGSLHFDLIQKIIEKGWKKNGLMIDDNDSGNKFLASIALINKHWNAALCEIVTELNLKKIWIGPLKAQLARFPHINSLKLTSVDTESLLAVTALAPLTELCLSSMDINNGTANSSIFSRFDKLRKLKFHNSPLIDDRYVRAIRKCTTLTDLDLSGCNLMTDNGLNSITQITGLTRLNLSECTEITSLGLQSLSNLRNLETLDLTGLRDSDVKAMSAIGSLTKLTQIVFHMSPTLSDAGVRNLAQVTSLIRLSLFGCDQISDEGLYEISKLKKLNYLNLGCCYRITDIGISYIVDLTALKELNLSFASITYDGLTKLSSLSEMRRLDLRGCDMGSTLTVNMIRQGMNFLKGYMADSHFRVIYN